MTRFLAALAIGVFAVAPVLAQEKKSEPTTEEAKKAEAKKDEKSEAKKSEAKKKVKKGGC